jgi:hypothetical protein
MFFCIFLFDSLGGHGLKRRTWPKKDGMSSQRRTYGNPRLNKLDRENSRAFLIYFIEKILALF